VIVGALLAEDMLGTTGLSGLPSALFTFGSAGAALAVGMLLERVAKDAVWLRPPSVAVTRRERGFAQR